MRKSKKNFLFTIDIVFLLFYTTYILCARPMLWIYVEKRNTSSCVEHSTCGCSLPLHIHNWVHFSFLLAIQRYMYKWMLLYATHIYTVSSPYICVKFLESIYIVEHIFCREHWAKINAANILHFGCIYNVIHTRLNI